MLISDSASSLHSSIYTYVHNPESSVLNRLNNKLYQRLYLPSKVSPIYTIFDLSSEVDVDVEIKRIINYFKERNITKIVLKHPDAFMGEGNVFIDMTQDTDAIREGINKLWAMPCSATSEYPTHLLVESQNTLPRISRKTGKEKTGFTAYRIVGIADENGVLGYFIATKSVSDDIDSHKRTVLKAYFDGPASAKGFTQHFGLKDKYYNIGNDRIPINPEVMHKVFKAAFSLYSDLSTMTEREFNQHINHLILSKKASESFVSLLEIVDEKNEITTKIFPKGERLIIFISTTQSKLPYEISLLLNEIKRTVKPANHVVSPSARLTTFYSSTRVRKIEIDSLSIQTFIDVVEKLKSEHNFSQATSNQKACR